MTRTVQKKTSEKHVFAVRFGHFACESQTGEDSDLERRWPVVVGNERKRERERSEAEGKNPIKVEI